MNTITLELKLPEEIYLALQSAGLSRDDLGTHAAHDLAAQLYAEAGSRLGRQQNWQICRNRHSGPC